MTGGHGQLPTFVVIGAMKAGTTTLHAWLATHPDVCMSARKELDFFLEDGNWHRGVDWYRAQFAGCGIERARGESSPNYAKVHLDPDVPSRMHSVIPDARLVYLIREPVARMRSMYRHLAIDGTETRSFAAAVATDSDYRQSSRYIQHIRSYLAQFDRDQLIVLTTEGMQTDPLGALKQVHEHVGVAPAVLTRDTVKQNVTAERTAETALSKRLKDNPAYWGALNRSWRLRSLHERLLTRPADVPPAALPDDLEVQLRSDLEEDTAELERFLGRRLTEWGR